MLALLASSLILVVPHDAAARGQLRPLERFAERCELVVDVGAGNALSGSAIEALRRWPALVAVELHLPLSPRDADQLRKLRRLAVRLPARKPGEPAPPHPSLADERRAEPSLALLGPALVRVERAPALEPGQGPCPGSRERVLPDGGSELRLDGPITQCALDWLRARLEPHAEPPGDLPPEMTQPPPAPAPPRRK